MQRNESSTPVTPSSPRANSGKKFKPARNIRPFPQPSLIVRPVTPVNPTMASNVPTPLSPVMTPRKDKQNAHVIDLSSPDPPPPSSRINPKKRLSSEHGHTFDPESPASKRTKWDSDADKENRFLGGPSAAHNANLVDMTMDDGDAVNIFSRSMVTAPVAGPSTPRHKKPVASSSNDPYVTQSSHADLKNKSLIQLKLLLEQNKKYRSKTMEAVMDYEEDSAFDLETLKLVDGVVKGRIKAINTAIAEKSSSNASQVNHDSRSATAEVPTAPNTPLHNVPPPSLPRSRKRSMTPTPTPNHPSADPSITEIAPVYSSYSSASATTTVGSSSSAQRQPAPHFLRKQGTAINIDDEEEVEVREDDEEGQTEDDDLWNSIHDIPLGDYQMQMEIPIAPIQAPLAGPVTPQNEEVPAPDSEDVTYLQADANADRDCYGSPHYPEIMKHLKSVFKLQGFRKNQLKAITATLSGKDVFVLMPTGGGKSLCYQLPAICKTGATKGVTFVISPLLALMNDQVWALKKLGVKVVEFNSDQTAAERSEAKASLTGRGPRPDIVYITPEGVEKNDMLKNIFDKLYREKQLARFVIDEAHLISSWGRDFRESYQCLNKLKLDYPGIPIMALTATANEECKQDIVARLNIPRCEMLTSSFNRSNLYYEVHNSNMSKKLVDEVAQRIKSRYHKQTGVIYSLSKRSCEEIAAQLREDHHIQAYHYHAEMSKEDKRMVQQEWNQSKIHVIVATIAFGMGIDKADVRFVIHLHIPKSLDAYYQETGRAGRDGKPADCVMFWGQGQKVSFDSMIDGGDAGYEEKKRQKDGVQDVISYCQDTVTCRRVQVLHHFGQDFNKAQCSKGCDNCNNDSAVVSEDMTDTAKAAIAIVKALLKNKHNVTKTIIGDILRGGNAKSVRDVSGEKLEQHGAAKHISRDKIGRLLDELLNNHVKGLKQIQKMNRGGFNNTYILVGTEANQILSGHKRVAINFRVADKQATASAAPRSRKTKQAVIQPTGKGKGKAATNPHEPIESYDDEMQDFRDFDEDEIDNVPPPKNMRRTRSEPQPKASASAAVNKAGDQTVIHLDALRAWRGEMAAQEDCDDEDIIDDEGLQMLVLMPPSDTDESVKGVLRLWKPYAEPEFIDDKARRYGRAIRRIFATDKTAPPSFTAPAPQVHVSDVPRPPPVRTATSRVKSFKPVEINLKQYEYGSNADGSGSASARKPASRR